VVAKVLLEFEFGVKGQRDQGQKHEKVRHFFGAVLGGVDHYASGEISACCLVCKFILQ